MIDDVLIEHLTYCKLGIFSVSLINFVPQHKPGASGK